MATTVAPGSSATFTIGAFGTISLTASAASTGTLTFTAGALDNLRSDAQFGLQSKTYGPFGAPGTVTIAVTSGVVAYDVAYTSADTSSARGARRLTLDSRAQTVLGGPVYIANGRAEFGLDPKSLVPLNARVYSTNYYVDVTNGNDANDGSTWALAFKSIWKGTTAGNAAAVPYTVNIAPGTYFRANSFSNNGTEVVPTQTCVFKGVGGKVVCINGDSHTWTLESGTTYQVTRSNAKRVFELDTFDADGDFYEATLAASLAACRATPGSWYTDGTTTYMNRRDGAQPTAANTMVILISVNSIRAATTGNMHMYGITQYGGNNGCIKISGNTTGKFYAEDCAFKYSANATYVDNVTSLDYALCVFNRCVASKSQKDGFNFHSANSVLPVAVMFDCMGYGNGTVTTSTSNNGATVHDAGLLIDFNGRYYNNYGGDFAHANASTLAIGICTHAAGGLSDVSRGGVVPDGVGFQVVSGATLQKYDCWGGTDLVTTSGTITSL
jgi:hypothetical protein